MFICCIRAIVLFSFISIDHAVISMNINLFGYARGGGGGGGGGANAPPCPNERTPMVFCTIVNR